MNVGLVVLKEIGRIFVCFNLVMIDFCCIVFKLMLIQ